MGVRETNKREIILLTLIVVFAAAIRFYHLGHKPLWLDEILHLLRSSKGSLKEIVLSVKEEVAAGPLDYIIQNSVVRCAGFSEFTARVHAALFGVLAIPMLYLMGKRLFGSKVALIASFLYAVYPLHHYYSQEGRWYALFVFLALCSNYLFLKCIFESEKKIYWIAASAINILYVYSYVFAALGIVAQGCFLICLYAEPVRRSLAVPGARQDIVRLGIRFLLGVVIVAATFLPWLIVSLPNAKGDFLTGFSAHKLPLRIIKEVGDGSYPLSAFLLFFFVVGLVALRRQEKWGPMAFLLLWFALPLPIILLLSWYRNHFFAIRYILFTTPALFLGVAYGIAHAGNVLRRPAASQPARIAGVALIAALSMIIIYQHEHNKKREDWKNAALFLRAHVKPGDRIIAVNTARVIAYYFPQIANYTVGLDEAAQLGRCPDSASNANRKSTLFILRSPYVTGAQAQAIEALLAGHKYDRNEFMRLMIFRLPICGP